MHVLPRYADSVFFLRCAYVFVVMLTSQRSSGIIARFVLILVELVSSASLADTYYQRNVCIVVMCINCDSFISFALL